MKKNTIYIIIVIILVMIIPSLVMASSNANKITAYVDLVISRSHTYIKTDHLLEDLLVGAFSETDKYSYFQKIETFNSEQNSYVNAEYVGIGVSMSAHPNGIIIISVFDYSPAAFLGLRTNDVIVSVNGELIADKSLTYIASIIKGPENTSVTLGVQRGEQPILSYVVTRQVVAMKTVKSYIIDDVGYVYISSFTNETGNEFALALEKFKNSGINNIILDLRNNGGGTLYGCVSVARQLVSDAVITKMNFKYPGYLDIRYISTEKDIDYNIVLLVNSHTASASEVVTGALKDNEAAIVIGETTFGKSVVQSSYKMLTPEAYEYYSNKFDVSDMYLLNRAIAMNGITPSDDEYLGAAKVTIGEYLTPNGHHINLVGIDPDIFVDYQGDLYINHNMLDGMLWIRKKYDLGMSSYEIFKAKVIMEQLGYQVGEMTVLYDEIMKLAVTKFQADQGLYPYGVLDYTTQDALNNILRYPYIQEDLQLKKAFEVIKEEVK